MRFVSRLKRFEERRLFIPELNGTTEEKGEYGRASSTVSTLDLMRLAPFVTELPFSPFAMPLEAGYCLGSITIAGERGPREEMRLIQGYHYLRRARRQRRHIATPIVPIADLKALQGGYAAFVSCSVCSLSRT